MSDRDTEVETEDTVTNDRNTCVTDGGNLATVEEQLFDEIPQRDSSIMPSQIVSNNMLMVLSLNLDVSNDIVAMESAHDHTKALENVCMQHSPLSSVFTPVSTDDSEGANLKEHQVSDDLLSQVFPDLANIAISSTLESKSEVKHVEAGKWFDMGQDFAVDSGCVSLPKVPLSLTLDAHRALARVARMSSSLVAKLYFELVKDMENTPTCLDGAYFNSRHFIRVATLSYNQLINCLMELEKYDKIGCTLKELYNKELFPFGNFLHPNPSCSRLSTLLPYRATSSWFSVVQKTNDPFLWYNEQTYWLSFLVLNTSRQILEVKNLRAALCQMCYVIPGLGRNIMLLQYAIGSHNYCCVDIGQEQYILGFLLFLWVKLANVENLVDNLPIESPAVDLPARYVNANSICCHSTRWETSLKTFEGRNLAEIFMEPDIIDIILIARCVLNHFPFDPGQVKKFKVATRVPEIEKYSPAAILFVAAEKLAWEEEFALIIKQPSVKDFQLAFLGCTVVTDFETLAYATWEKLRQYGSIERKKEAAKVNGICYQGPATHGTTWMLLSIHLRWQFVASVDQLHNDEEVSMWILVHQEKRKYVYLVSVQLVRLKDLK